ncbi:2-hydroxycarboxylate transporter family protein [Lacrimispora sp.]|uniref:2-hydroxycarboxylate transporter family protein n=1 Tax=Lacrimispora sp. TaxID=2719234 RepID=UPI003460DB77
MGNVKEFKPFGLPWWIAAVVFGIVMFAASTGALSNDLAGSFALMLSIGLVCNEIGERIPFWNSYIGGGLVLTFLVSACLFSYNLIPEEYATGIAVVMDEIDFLSFFIIFLIVGSILSLERKLMIRSFVGYIPAIFGGLIGAAILGIIAGIPFGINPSSIIIKYMLPIMGGGNGAGAVPLSQIYETVTGEPASSYYSFAITILTIANIFAILTAAILHKIGEAKTTWTGDGTQLIRSGENFASEDKKITSTMKDLGGAFFLAVGFYALGRLFAKTLLPEVFGTPIHQFAYMIIFVALAAGFGIIPDNIRAAAKKLQSFFSNNIILIIMVGVGADTNIIELLQAITPGNVIIALAVVIGAILGSAVVGYLVGFYPIDSAITAGLCMANRGGSGDLAVLGASHRMPLMAYAQLSSRLGGGIVLILGSIIFGAFAK